MKLHVRGTRLTLPGTVIAVFDAATLQPLAIFQRRSVAAEFIKEMMMREHNVFVIEGKNEIIP